MATATQDTKAQDTNKGAAAPAQAPATKVSDLSKEALMELVVNGSTDPKVFEALQNLNKADETKREAKKGTVTKLVAEMEKYGITFIDLKQAGAQVPDLDKMFDEQTIKLVAAKYFTGGKASRTRKPRAEGSTTPRADKKTGIELFAFKPTGAKGKSSTFNQGQDKPVVFGKGHEFLKNMKGDVTENLMKHLTTKDAEKATAYLKTPEGKAELAKIAQYISTGGEVWGEPAAK